MFVLVMVGEWLGAVARESLTRVGCGLGSTYGDNNCVHDEDVGVCCGGDTAAPSSDDGSCPWTGDGSPEEPGNGDLHVADCQEDCCCRLEVFYDGSWGTICDDSFNDDAGVIACRQMGLPSTDVRIQVGGSGYGATGTVPGTGQIWLDGVDCSSTDPTRLEDCPHT